MSQTTPTCIDSILLNFDTYKTDCGTKTCALSDHLPLFFFFSEVSTLPFIPNLHLKSNIETFQTEF